MIQRLGDHGAMRRRVVRMVGLCLVAVIVLGLSACDVGLVVLEGTLTHADTGEPLADLAVRVYSSTEETVVARGRTGGDGVYRFQSGALADGTYRVVFSGGHWWESGTSWDTATDVTVSSGQPADLDAALVPTTATLWGDTDYYDGWPMSGYRVEVLHADTGELVATAVSQDWSVGEPIEGIPCSGRGSTGCFQLDLPTGDLYWVRIANSPFFGMVDGEFGIELGLGGRHVDLHHPYPARLEGRVVDPLGAPIPGASVLAIPSRAPVPPMPSEATTGADGTWAVGVGANEPHRLLVVGPDGDATLAGMVDGDPQTATEVTADVYSTVDVGDITLGDP